MALEAVPLRMAARARFERLASGLTMTKEPERLGVVVAPPEPPHALEAGVDVAAATEGLRVVTVGTLRGLIPGVGLV